MTIEKAKQEIPDFDTFATKYCDMCMHDVFCDFYCCTIAKAERIFDHVQKVYARHNGDMAKVERYIKNAKE